MTIACQAQSIQDFFNDKAGTVTWLGIDYSHVKLIGEFTQFKDASQYSTSEIRKVDYVSKDEALKRAKKTWGPDQQLILDNLPGNPLPASFEIQVRDTSQVDAVAAKFIGNPAVDDNVPNSNKHDSVVYAKATVRRMLGAIDLVEKGMWVAMVLFASAAVLLISTTVRLSIFSRRREIEIMRLVGATSWFIRWPFVFEGFITGFVGSLLAGVFVWILSATFMNWVNAHLRFISLMSYPAWAQSGSWPFGLLPTLILLGAVLGAAGGGVALRRYLKV